MLTPHEVATLMLIDEATPNIKDLDRAAVHALIEQDLVELEDYDPGHWRPSITTRGSSILSAIARGR
ncbi:hypothetical protein [Cupriavidus lacunae]|uniref:Preprotein translocase subunit SecA n=1 Tax=Cupriavidus lacunae TaxID=2666307 RepID=A0A370NWG4_9BURK|nr:hypothetical protein [Cupriavidus lacunae]RDK09944.1 hypothetical protein DN412_12590 [Cupriavidus lacunae]